MSWRESSPLVGPTPMKKGQVAGPDTKSQVAQHILLTVAGARLWQSPLGDLEGLHQAVRMGIFHIGKDHTHYLVQTIQVAQSILPEPGTNKSWWNLLRGLESLCWAAGPDPSFCRALLTAWCKPSRPPSTSCWLLLVSGQSLTGSNR